MRINTNIGALNAYNNLENTNANLNASLAKLSSGYRINKAADDASGVVISENLKSQVSGLQQATRNAQDGISVVQTAEGALSSVQSMLQRIRDLVIQSANTGASDSTARQAAQNEIVQLRNEMDDHDIYATHTALIHAQQIVDELLNSLDLKLWPEGGSLAAIYRRVQSALIAANVNKDPAAVHACRALLVPIRDAWREAAGVVSSNAGS